MDSARSNSSGAVSAREPDVPHLLGEHDCNLLRLLWYLQWPISVKDEASAAGGREFKFEAWVAYLFDRWCVLEI